MYYSPYLYDRPYRPLYHDFYPYRDYYRERYYDSQIANVNQSIYNLGYMTGVTQSSIVNQVRYPYFR